MSLPRKVALKFLPETLRQDEIARKRFVREAESAAVLDHPYICNFMEVSRTEDGQDFEPALLGLLWALVKLLED